MKISTVFFLVGIVGLFSANQTCIAQWSHDPNTNTPVCTVAGDQYTPAMTGDDSGGTIFAWTDPRSGSGDIYAQRFTKEGVRLWTLNGVQIINAPNNQDAPVIASDGSGGAIIVWPDARNGIDYDIYAQRINSAGVPQWTANGVPICTATGFQASPLIIPDGSGGAIITWVDQRSGPQDIYAQRVNGAGVVQWTSNGVPICTAADNQSFPAMISDGSGGTIIVWEDNRTGTTPDIYAQRVNSAGTAQWTANGVPVCTASSSQLFPQCVGDSSGGAIIVWEDGRNGSQFDIYAQRINGSGVAQWTVNGIAVSQATNSQSSPTVIGDGSGGAITTWMDIRNGVDQDIYAQRIDPSGSPQWTQDGVAVCTAANFQLYPVLASDGSGGAIITWTDYRNGSAYDIYAQRLNNLGTPLWAYNGTAVSTAPQFQALPSILSDGIGGAVIAWEDQRSGGYDIYGDRIDNMGYLGYNYPRLSFVQDVPADQGGKVTVAFDASSYDQFPYQVVTSYTIWRGVVAPANVPSNSSGIFKTPSGKTIRKITSAMGNTYWEQVGTVNSHYFPTYSFTAPTLNDSDQTGTHTLQYLVSAETWNQYVFWDSNIDSGYSVDNLPPGAVQTVIAQPQTGSSVLVHWSPDLIDPDVNGYNVYRSTTPGFTPGPSTKIGQTADTLFVDPSPSGSGTNYYRIVTVDLHGNLSPPSPQAVAGAYNTQVYTFDDQWDLVSVPLVVSNFAKTALFPAAVSDAFAYSGSYMVKPTLTNGIGYWLRFSGSHGVSMTGFQLDQDTLNVAAGWNLIGSISSPLNVMNITSIPGGITTSQFFGYTNGYSTTSTLEPGRGYWVKVSQDGKLILSSSTAQSDAARITIIPGNDVPPSPPGDDLLGLNGTIPVHFSLEQNYPNPFNPSTEIRYQLPQAEWVTLKVFNMLGQEVATLVNEYQDAGYKTTIVNMNTLPSGIYMYRIMAGKFSDMKKMILLK